LLGKRSELDHWRFSADQALTREQLTSSGAR
jgi:hypothetical protein